MLYGIVSQRFYWPSLSEDTQQFTRNCDLCRSSMIWREQRQGLLKLLPIPDCKWQEISMDFVTELPDSDGCTNLLVITDHLGKGIILVPMSKIMVPTTTVSRSGVVPTYGLI